MTLLAGVCLGAGAARAEYPWPASSSSDALERRVPTPNGFVRVPLAEGSFGAFLRALPVLEGRPHVLLYDGRQKANQGAHELVVDLDVGSRDLQQCADAVFRLRAEYLWSAGGFDDICCSGIQRTAGRPGIGPGAGCS